MSNSWYIEYKNAILVGSGVSMTALAWAFIFSSLSVILHAKDAIIISLILAIFVGILYTAVLVVIIYIKKNVNNRGKGLVVGIVIIAITYILMHTQVKTELFGNETFLYKGEFAFYPFHVILVSVLLAVFIGIMYIIHKIGKKKYANEKYNIFLDEDVKKIIESKFKKKGKEAIEEFNRNLGTPEKEPIPIEGLDAGAVVSLGALIIALIGIFISSFIQSPILDYDVVEDYHVVEDYDKINKKQYIIKINNYGNEPAKNVLISLEQNGIKFNHFESNPFLSNHFKYNTSNKLTQVEGFVKIDVIPAFSKTDIITVPSDNTTNTLKINVRSDETIGKQNTISLMLLYAPLLLTFLIFPILFWRAKIHRYDNNFIFVIFVVIMGAVFGSIIVSYYFRL